MNILQWKSVAVIIENVPVMYVTLIPLRREWRLCIDTGILGSYLGAQSPLCSTRNRQWILASWICISSHAPCIQVYKMAGMHPFIQVYAEKPEACFCHSVSSSRLWQKGCNVSIPSFREQGLHMLEFLRKRRNHWTVTRLQDAGKQKCT